jgi:hypothetical protein
MNDFIEIIIQGEINKIKAGLEKNIIGLSLR